MTPEILTSRVLEQLFTKAHTANAWQDKPVEDGILKEIYDVMKNGPTSANGCPLRMVFVKTKEAKEKLKPLLSADNVNKTMTAPVTVLFAQDMKFYDHLPFLYPQADARSWFAGNEKVIVDTALRNSSLQAAYFMVTARAFGLDCGPMSGFDADKVNAAFFHDSSFKVNFICNLGYGAAEGFYPRNPRFEFKDVCKIV
jgi:3-hydroxypropanoate dehydrogenase